MAVVTLMVAKVDKGERVGQWKGPLIGVRWHVGGRRAARAAEGGGRGAQDPAEGRELLQERRVKEGGRSRGSEWELTKESQKAYPGQNTVALIWCTQLNCVHKIYRTHL